MKGMADKSVDLIICDLPFGCLAKQDIKIAYTERRGNCQKDMTGCPWDIKIDLELFWKEVKRIRKDAHTPCLMFCTTKYGYELIKSNEKEFRYDLVWDKQRGVSFLSANKMPMRSHEMIYVFSKAGAKYNRIDIKGDFKGWNVKRENIPSETSIQYSTKRKDSEGGDGKRCVLSVIDIMGGNRKTNGHPTEKPLELYKFLIERYSDVGDTVLDPTFGSGNSGLASIELRRKYIGIEKDNNFFWKAVNKLI
jgi:site-specific DNA-methyltransferase (adenine-specific)